MLISGTSLLHLSPNELRVENGFDYAYGKICAVTVGVAWDFSRGGSYINYEGIKDLSFDFNPLSYGGNYVIFNSTNERSEASVSEWYLLETTPNCKIMSIEACEITKYVQEVGGINSSDFTLWIDPHRFKCNPFGINTQSLECTTYHNIFEYYTDHARAGYRYFVPKIENYKLSLEEVEFDDLEKYIHDDTVR